MKRLLLLVATCIMGTGCMSVTVDEDNVCSSKATTFQGLPASVADILAESTVSHSIDQDISGTLSKLTDVAQISLTSVDLTLTGLSFAHHLKVVLHAEGREELVFSDSDYLVFNGKVPVSVDKRALLTLLESGKVTMTVFVTGHLPTGDVKISSDFCVGVTGHSDKSVVDIVK